MSFQTSCTFETAYSEKEGQKFRSRTFLEDSQENYCANCGQVATHLEIVATLRREKNNSREGLLFTVKYNPSKGANQKPV